MTVRTTNEELLVLILAPYCSHGGLQAFHSPANEVGMSPTEEDR